MKSLNIDIIFPWEIGLILVKGILIIIGIVRKRNRQFDNIPFIKPTTKIFIIQYCVFLDLYNYCHYSINIDFQQIKRLRNINLHTLIL